MTDRLHFESDGRTYLLQPSWCDQPAGWTRVHPLSAARIIARALAISTGHFQLFEWERPHHASRRAEFDRYERESHGPEPELYWIEITVADEFEEPVAGASYELELPDGASRRGKTDDRGLVQIRDIGKAGKCVMTVNQLPAPWAGTKVGEQTFVQRFATNHRHTLVVPQPPGKILFQLLSEHGVDRLANQDFTLRGAEIDVEDQTDANGRFEYAEATFGAYRLTVASGTFFVQAVPRATTVPQRVYVPHDALRDPVDDFEPEEDPEINEGGD
jgi:hypothetical protein